MKKINIGGNSTDLKNNYCVRKKNSFWHFPRFFRFETFFKRTNILIYHDILRLFFSKSLGLVAVSHQSYKAVISFS